MEAITRRSRMTPCPRGADRRNDSHREGQREHTCKTTSRQSLSNYNSARLTRQHGHKQSTPSMQGLWVSSITMPNLH
jgi:hypothetical protein